eukprot:scaffold126563_cov31-Prasinocladus_malaysianus.AAC.1
MRSQYVHVSFLHFTFTDELEELQQAAGVTDLFPCWRHVHQVVASLVKRLAEEYLTLLPEAIPFLAELLEDPNQEVEARAQELVKDLEVLAGESLDPFMKAG